jgi:hypothetical protein
MIHLVIVLIEKHREDQIKLLFSFNIELYKDNLMKKVG